MNRRTEDSGLTFNPLDAIKDATSASPKKKRRITTEDDEDEWSGPVGVEYPGF